MEQCLGQLHVKFADGRAVVAQQLHRITQKNVVRASLGGDDPVPGLPRVIGGHVDGRGIASLVDGDPTSGSPE